MAERKKCPIDAVTSSSPSVKKYITPTYILPLPNSETYGFYIYSIYVKSETFKTIAIFLYGDFTYYSILYVISIWMMFSNFSKVVVYLGNRPHISENKLGKVFRLKFDVIGIVG